MDRFGYYVKRLKFQFYTQFILHALTQYTENGALEMTWVQHGIRIVLLSDILAIV